MTNTPKQFYQILCLETYFHEDIDIKNGPRIEGGLHEDPHILKTIDEGNPCIAASNTKVLVECYYRLMYIYPYLLSGWA